MRSKKETFGEPNWKKWGYKSKGAVLKLFKTKNLDEPPKKKRKYEKRKDK